MEATEIRPLYDTYHRRIAKVSLTFKRFLHDEINWNVRMIGIKGARGVGKTTLLLQHILEYFPDVDRTLYVSLDDLWFSTHSLTDLVDWANLQGITHLFLDEVHRYRSWSETLKYIYDSYPDISIVYTSSSILSLDNSNVDLSRRQTLYELPGFSFREYLEFEGVIKMAPLPLEELLGRHVALALQLTSGIKIQPLFDAYLKHGYYPFYKESGEDYMTRLRAVVALVLDTDLPAVEKISYETVEKVRKLMMILTEHVPFVPNMSMLWKQLATNNDLGLKMLYALDRAALLNLLTSKAKSYKHLFKPDKIFINNANLMYALSPVVDKGNLRETFFLNQLGVRHTVRMPEKGDFLVDDRYFFEVGGKGKTFEQIKDVADSWLAVDDTECGHQNRIPLWMFGLTY